MLNKCSFIGNLGKDPEIRQTQAGKKIANLSLAVTERWKDADGERKERTEWIRAVIFNEKLAGIAEQYLKKGSKIYLEGQMATKKWTDKEGVERYTTEIVLQGFNGYFEMLDGREDKPSDERSVPAGEAKPRAQSSSSLNERLDDEITF